MADKLPRNRFLAAIGGVAVAIAGLTCVAWLDWPIFGIILTIFGAIWLTAALEGDRL